MRWRRCRSVVRASPTQGLTRHQYPVSASRDEPGARPPIDQRQQQRLMATCRCVCLRARSCDRDSSTNRRHCCELSCRWSLANAISVGFGVQRPERERGPGLCQRSQKSGRLCAVWCAVSDYVEPDFNSSAVCVSHVCASVAG